MRNRHAAERYLYQVACQLGISQKAGFSPGFFVSTPFRNGRKKLGRGPDSQRLASYWPALGVFFSDYLLCYQKRKKIRIEVHLSELWTVVSRLSTIIRSKSNKSYPTGMIEDNHIFFLFEID